MNVFHNKTVAFSFIYHIIYIVSIIIQKGRVTMKHSLSLVALLLVASVVPATSVLALDTQSLVSSETKETTKDLVPIPPVVQKTMDRLFSLQPELKKLHIITSTNREDNQHFRVYLNDRTEEEIESGKEGMSAHLEFDEKTGELLSFNISAAAWASDKLPSLQLTYDTADKFLTQWLGREGRKQFGKPVSYGSGGSASYHEDGTITAWRERDVEFPLILNGIPVESDIGPRIGVNSFGYVTSYAYTPIDLEKVTVPKPDTALPVEEIKQKIITADSIGLNYVEAQPEKYGSNWNDAKMKPALLYQIQLLGYYQPQTGQPIDTLSGTVKKQESITSTALKKITLQPKGQPLIVHSEDEAKQMLSKLFGNKVAVGDLRIENSPFFAQDEVSSQQVYEFSTEDHKTRATVITDKKTGQVQHARLRGDTEQKSTPIKVTEEQAFAVARDFVETYAGPTATQLASLDVISEEPEIPAWVDKSKLPEVSSEHFSEVHVFFFVELYQGIPVQDRMYQVSVDNRTGDIVSFHFPVPQEKLNLPDSKHIVTKEQALSAFLNHKSMKLQYIWPRYMDQRAPAPFLVYTWDYAEGLGYVDALTGNYIIISSEQGKE
ncbi:hypothetical protein HMPREF0083_04744 [Aneurinibacillus aneurinilyticus ATCC 12856]|uniref:YcdB/YcdC repeated domain-containing protein n=2 Tax=Aneurinibacillus aneurinilyticus TaxID=1391 RepID=U1Y8K1_ANEAE|nr:hypothetical protein HMPREF0083_04744 [Aneurinibacillus aneurinilyticus ATCC 12856]